MATAQPQVRVAPDASRDGQASRKPKLEPASIVIFGATGDLAARKLFPALYSLDKNGFLTAEYTIVGVGRRDYTDEQFREQMRQALAKFRPESANDPHTTAFLSHIYYHKADFTNVAQLRVMRDHLEALSTSLNLPGNRLFYLATDPEYFEPIVEGLSEADLVAPWEADHWTRVVIEKPYGRDLSSARALDYHVHQYLREEQVYRIDHYLGKETVQNILAFRFGNAIFEPLLSRQYVDHVQITAAETVGMENGRGGFYDHAGALRDVVQNHLLQVLSLVAMEPPATMKASDMSDSKLKVLRSLTAIRGKDVDKHVVRAQYTAGHVDDQEVLGYRQEQGVAPNSTTESYVALRVGVDNWRWAGVPFLVRTGKRMARHGTEVAIQFKQPPLSLFRTVECEGDVCDLTAARPNVLSFRIQPDEGIQLTFSTKRPGMTVDLQSVRMEFCYDRAFHLRLPEAYERLLLDALRGDSTLFMHSEELLAAWEFATPILESWQRQPTQNLFNYPAGSWGPPEADRLLEGCASTWRQP